MIAGGCEMTTNDLGLEFLRCEGVITTKHEQKNLVVLGIVIVMALFLGRVQAL